MDLNFHLIFIPTSKMNTVFYTVPQSFYKIAKTNFKAEFSITVTLVRVNAKALFSIAYYAVFNDFPNLLSKLAKQK